MDVIRPGSHQLSVLLQPIVISVGLATIEASKASCVYHRRPKASEGYDHDIPTAAEYHSRKVRPNVVMSRYSQ